MKGLLLLAALAFLVIGQAFAEVKIIEIGEESKDVLSLYLDNGEIIQIKRNNVKAISIAKDAFLTKDSIQILKKQTFINTPNIAQEIEIVAGETPYTPITSNNKNMFSREEYKRIRFSSKNPLEKSNISVLPNYETAQSVMDHINGGTDDDSQCYNRAHMWTYEALIKDNVNLGKVWIFFTKKYTREFNYKWWFHVAPYTHVNDSNVRYVLDRGFFTVPFNLRSWTDYFMENNAECRVVTDYNQYRKNQKREYCFLIFSSQYYWQPWQIEKLSNRGTHFWGYKPGELKITYPDALIRGTWNRTIPTLDSRVHTGTRFPVSVNGRIDEGRTNGPGTPGDGETDVRDPAPERNGVPYMRVQYSRGDEVVDNNLRTGDVERVLLDGRILVDYDNSSLETALDVRDLGKRLRRQRAFGLAEGDQIVVGNRTGNIERLYSNGILRVDIDNQRSDSMIRVSDGVAAEVRSINGFQRGVDVVDTNGNRGEVKQVFANGLARIDFKRFGDRVVDLSTVRRR